MNEMNEKEQKEILNERYHLVMERIREIPGEQCLREDFRDYFDKMAEFAMLLDDTRSFLESGSLEKASLEELQERNRALYADILPGHYGESYGNPAYAVRKLGEFVLALCGTAWVDGIPVSGRGRACGCRLGAACGSLCSIHL